MTPMPAGPAVYLLHFTPRFGHAGHYLGQADDLSERMGKHQGGNGSKLVARAIEAGCQVELVRWWPGTRALEATFKRHGGDSPRSQRGRHGAKQSLVRYCPRCNDRAHLHRPSLRGWVEGIPYEDVTDITDVTEPYPF